MRQTGEIVIARFWGVFFERVEVILLTFKVLFLVVTERLAVWAWLVCATMSARAVSILCFVKSKTKNAYWARLSEREKALLHRGQT